MTPLTHVIKRNPDGDRRLRPPGVRKDALVRLFNRLNWERRKPAPGDAMAALEAGAVGI